MANDIVLGLDCGTSYVKAIAQTHDGKVIFASRVISPRPKILKPVGASDVYFTFEWCDCIKHLVHLMYDNFSAASLNIKGICVSGITPTLTVFDVTNYQKAYSIPYWVTSFRNNDGEYTTKDFGMPRTTQRINTLLEISEIYQLKTPVITDLVGYINWCFTGNLTINSVALSELGILANESMNFLSLKGGPAPVHSAPVEIAGFTNNLAETIFHFPTGIPVASGFSDSMGSILASGISDKSDRMIYLGTFGSLLKLNLAVSEILMSSTLASYPYTWLLSVPHFGPAIEVLAVCLFKSSKLAESLKLLDHGAHSSSPGANGLIFLLPRWNSKGEECGFFTFLNHSRKDDTNNNKVARSILEALGYAIQFVEPTHGVSRPLWVSGGGARSHTWLTCLSDVTQRELYIRDGAWDATGTADLAMMSISQKETFGARTTRNIKPNSQKYNRIIQNNIERSKSYYSGL